MRAVYAVGWDSGFPWEVFALFTSRQEAQRHADGAAYVFRVFALPVYEACAEVPRAFRPPWTFGSLGTEQMSDEVTLTTDALIDGEIDVVEPGTIVAVVDFDPPEPCEVRLLFSHASPAMSYIQAAIDWNAGMMRPETMPVYGSYDECPPEHRHTTPGPALSQHVRPRCAAP